VGSDEWSIAVGEDWERNESEQTTQYVRSLGEVGRVTVSVASEPRLRGPLDEVYGRYLDELAEQYSEVGLTLATRRSATVDGLSAREVVVRPLYAGRAVAVLTRGMVQQRHAGQVWCTVPVERFASAREECLRIVATLTPGEAPAPEAGSQTLHRGEFSLRVPAAWINATRPSHRTSTWRSDRTADPITVEFDAVDLEVTDAEFLANLASNDREAGATIVRTTPGRAPGRRWADVELTKTPALSVEILQRIVARGGRFFVVTCAEPFAEISAGRARCAPVVESLRFGSP
jgi:hypothetical protein